MQMQSIIKETFMCVQDNQKKLLNGCQKPLKKDQIGLYITVIEENNILNQENNKKFI